MQHKGKKTHGFKITFLLSTALLALVVLTFYFLFEIPIKTYIDRIDGIYRNYLYNKIPEKFEFVRVDSKANLNKRLENPANLGDLSSVKWANLECVKYTKGNTDLFMNKQIISKYVKDKNLDEKLEEIGEREYLEPPRYYENYKGEKVNINEGKKNKKKILYESLCRSGATYYFIFTTTDIELSFNFLVPTAYAGGGEYWGPQSLAIISGDNLKIAERIGKRHPSAYWNCSSIFGLSESNLYFSCGGGDGGGGGSSSINKLNLNTLLHEEILYCESDLAGPDFKKVETKCVNN